VLHPCCHLCDLQAFFMRPAKMRGTIPFVIGIVMVLIGWTFFGMVFELFGILNLFGYVIAARTYPHCFFFLSGASAAVFVSFICALRSCFLLPNVARYPCFLQQFLPDYSRHAAHTTRDRPYSRRAGDLAGN
jgi:hypothetical protein